MPFLVIASLFFTLPAVAQSPLPDTNTNAQPMPEYPLPKAEVNSCLESANRVGYYLACGKNADTITGPSCKSMRKERFRRPPRLQKGFVEISTDSDLRYSQAEASQLIASDGSGKTYRKAMWDAAKAVDKRLLALNIGGWVAEIGSWYFLGTGRLLVGGAMNLSGWGMSAASSGLLAKNLTEAANEHLVKAYWHVQQCRGHADSDQHALSEAQIRSCIDQKLPHQSVVETFSGLVATGRAESPAREQLRALASEGYSWELPSAQFTVACALITQIDSQMKAAEESPASCDSRTGLIDLNGKKFRQKLEWSNEGPRGWYLESEEPFVEVKEGILRKTGKKKAYINLAGAPLPDNEKDRVDLGEAFARQATLIAPKLLEMKACGGPGVSHWGGKNPQGNGQGDDDARTNTRPAR